MVSVLIPLFSNDTWVDISKGDGDKLENGHFQWKPTEALALFSCRLRVTQQRVRLFCYMLDVDQTISKPEEPRAS